jgi:hypothetical protein
VLEPSRRFLAPEHRERIQGPIHTDRQMAQPLVPVLRGSISHSHARPDDDATLTKIRTFATKEDGNTKGGQRWHELSVVEWQVWVSRKFEP